MTPAISSLSFPVLSRISIKNSAAAVALPTSISAEERANVSHLSRWVDPPGVLMDSFGVPKGKRFRSITMARVCCARTKLRVS